MISLLIVPSRFHRKSYPHEYAWFQRLVDSHETFKLTLGEADKEFNSIIALVNEVHRIAQQYGITSGHDNPYALITGQVRQICKIL